ncbi:MAG: OadG family protein [Thermodesulfobacteriota bacterium]
MWIEATEVAIIGFTVVFLTLAILAVSVKVMSFSCRLYLKKYPLQKKEDKYEV